jgi:hypothetical protein
MPACDQSRPKRGSTWPSTSLLVMVPSMSEIMSLMFQSSRYRKERTRCPLASNSMRFWPSCKCSAMRESCSAVGCVDCTLVHLKPQTPDLTHCSAGFHRQRHGTRQCVSCKPGHTNSAVGTSAQHETGAAPWPPRCSCICIWRKRAKSRWWRGGGVSEGSAVTAHSREASAATLGRSVGDLVELTTAWQAAACGGQVAAACVAAA